MTVLNKFRDVVVVNADRKLLELSLDMRDAPAEVRRNAFSGNDLVGWFYLHANEAKQPGMVMEQVMSRPGGDAITSLYIGHPIFENKAELIRARALLIRAIADKVGLSPESVGIDDGARGRTVGLEELATGQLIDLLAERMGHVVMKSDNHAQDIDALTVMADGTIGVS